MFKRFLFVAFNASAKCAVCAHVASEHDLGCLHHNKRVNAEGTPRMVQCECPGMRYTTVVVR
jgi:hypothetical protein